MIHEISHFLLLSVDSIPLPFWKLRVSPEVNIDPTLRNSNLECLRRIGFAREIGEKEA